MADIIDSRVTKFLNEQLRPLSEKMRDLNVLISDAKIKYDNEIGFILGDYQMTDTINDGRLADGVSSLTRNDVILVVTQWNAFVAQMSGTGVSGVINKPCVRSLVVR